jgi:hypothetical protein
MGDEGAAIGGVLFDLVVQFGQAIEIADGGKDGFDIDAIERTASDGAIR